MVQRFVTAKRLSGTWFESFFVSNYQHIGLMLHNISPDLIQRRAQIKSWIISPESTIQRHLTEACLSAAFDWSARSWQRAPFHACLPVWPGGMLVYEFREQGCPTLRSITCRPPSKDQYKPACTQGQVPQKVSLQKHPWSMYASLC